MNIGTKQLIEITGISAVVLSLIFVAWELRQSNRIAIATAETDLRSANRELISLVADNSILAAVIVKARDTSVQMNSTEQEIFKSYARASFNILSQANAAFENGLLTTYSLDIYRNRITRDLDIDPALINHFAQTVRDFDLHLSNTELWNYLVDELRSRGLEF